MKTNTERKAEIVKRLQEIDSLKEERSVIEHEAFRDEIDPVEYYQLIDKFCAINTSINRMRGVVKRMIKKLMNDIYGSWSLIDENDFVEIVSNFKKFA